MFGAGDDECCMAHFPAECRRSGQEDVLGMACHAVGDSSESVSQLRDARGGIREVDVEVADVLVLKCGG